MGKHARTEPAGKHRRTDQPPTAGWLGHLPIGYKTRRVPRWYAAIIVAYVVTAVVAVVAL